MAVRLTKTSHRIAFQDVELGPVLGQGTVGTVYRATVHGITDGPVAIKILQEAICTDELVRRRFRREMEILQRLNHPHIIRYFGGGEDEGKLFYAMELLEAGNVSDLLGRYDVLSWQESASIGRQVCSALQYAHNQGIIHRDLKPSNLFLSSDGQVKLGDFGIARDTHAADITSHGLTVGTHAYMSPEQIKGETLSGKADLYALGCVLFELLTGRKPFEGPNFAALFEQHLHTQPASVREYVPDCPKKMDEIIQQLMQKDPEDRPFNARAVQGVLLELLASDGARNQGVPAQERIDVPLEDRDVGAASVSDPGLGSLARKLAPVERPEASWTIIAILAAVVAAIIGAAWFAQ